QGAARALGNADEAGISCGSPHDSVAAKSERIGTKRPGAERKVPEFLPDCSPPVRAVGGGAMTHVPKPDEIVPEALRQQLGWDARHDGMARLIIDEFALTLPRERELIRQLAFIRVQQGEAHVMPFGKYKGRLLEEILIDDPSYVDWLAAQDWFRTEFPALHEVIVNFDAEEEEEAF